MRRWFLIVLVCHCIPIPHAFACGDGGCAGEQFSALRGGSCEPPACTDAPDMAPNTSQLERVSAMASGPLQLDNDGGVLPVGCYAVKRKTTGYYMAFSTGAVTTGDPPVTTGVFRRFTARTGLNDWVDAGVANGISPTQFSWQVAFNCPDPHFESPTSSNMTMFYSAFVTPGNEKYHPGTVVMRATSTDDGVNWSVDPDPIVVGDGTYCPYMPSYAEFEGRHLLAFAWVCVDGSAHPQIHVYESDDGVDDWYAIATAVTLGFCDGGKEGEGEWDDGAVNRPRMIVDPATSKLLMFYAGYPWDGTEELPTRLYASLGVAVSANGCDWAVAEDPILSPTNTPYWDVKTAIIPSVTYTNNAQTRFRVYYIGRGSGFNGAPAAAEADFAGLVLPQCPSNEPCWSQRPALAEADVELGRVEVTAHPNPTTGSVTIGLDLSRVHTTAAVDVVIYDVTGRAVRTVWKGSTSNVPANLSWDGRSADGRRVSAGNYLVRVRVAGDVAGTHLITYLR